MSENIPALIAWNRKRSIMYSDQASSAWRAGIYGDEHPRALEKLSAQHSATADALESLSAPSGDDCLPERLEAQATFVPETRMADVMHEAAMALRAARRPSPVTREALKTVADAIRRNCTPDWDAYQAGGDVLIAAVADWVENPPEWVTELRSLPEPAEVEWEYGARPLGYPTDPVALIDGTVDAEYLNRIGGYAVMRRTKAIPASPWVPVKGTEQ